MKNSAFSLSIILVFLLGLGAYNTSDSHKESFELVWEDDFDGEKLDTAIWTPIIGDGCPDLCGWGNKELQYYLEKEENIRVENGALILEAHKKKMRNRQYTSAKVVTKSKAEWRYGKIEVRARLPYGVGTWPAIWMLPTKENRKWPDDGEIDIVEHVGYNQGMIYGAIHSKKYNGGIGTHKVDSTYIADAHENFHTYSIEWSEDTITWYVDEKQYQKLTKDKDGPEGWPFNQFDYHLIINLAVGGNWGGKYGIDDDIWPQTLAIDYVRYYKPLEK